MVKLKLFYKFLLFVLPCIFVSIIVTGLVLSLTNWRFFERSISSNYGNIIKASGGEIRQYVENAHKDLEGLAAVLATTKADLFRQEMALVAFRETAPYFDSLALVSPQGEIMATTDAIGNDTNDIARSRTFETAVSGQGVISEVMRTSQNVPFAHVAVPILSLKKVSAVIWGKLNLKWIWEVLEGIRIGETGQTYLMDLRGRPVGHREMDRVVRATPMVSPQILQRLLVSSEEPVQWTGTIDGKRIYCLGSIIPKLDWIIVLSQDEGEAHSFIYQNMQWAVALTTAICLIAVCVGWFALRRVLRPMHNLHRQAQRIGEGDLDQVAEVESGDEIGDLSAAFNKMTESIKSHIAQQVKTAKELAHARNLATLGAASSKLTHEVGNLMNNIEIILLRVRREQLSPAVEESLRILDVEARRIGRFIENLLQFARKPQLRLQKIGLDVIIQEVIAIHGLEAEKRGARIELDWPYGLPPVSVDASLMYQVVNNLIKNCLETPKDPSLIRIGGEAEEGCLRVTVKDDGGGMEAHILERIFEPFFSTKTNKGTGVGLAICKTIVDAHRGTIECRSKAGKYTEFIIRLPLK